MSGGEIALIAVAVLDAVIAALPGIVVSIVLQVVVSLLTGTPSSSSSTTINGQRMSDTGVPSSGYSVPIVKPFGNETRISGMLIWQNQIREQSSTQVAEQVVGGGKAGSSTTVTTTNSYYYFADFAIMFCNGPITGFSKLRANGKELSADFIAKYCTIYLGSTTQLQDITMSDSLGVNYTPAYRGRAYIVFKNVPLVDFQNHVPEISAYVTTSITTVGAMVNNLMSYIPAVGYFIDSALSLVVIKGAALNDLSPIKAGLQILSMAYGMIVVESDGILKFIKGRSG